MQHLDFFWQLSRTNKRIISMLLDSLFISIAFHLAFWGRTGNLEHLASTQVWAGLLVLIVLSVLMFTRLGLYRAIWRYLSYQVFYTVCVGAVLSAFFMAIINLYINDEYFIPQSVPIIYCAFLALICGAARILVRSMAVQTKSRHCKNVVVYGAGSGGRELAMALRNSVDYRVRAFVDGDITLWNSTILGIPVLSLDNIDAVITKYGVSQILLAVPSAKRSRRRLILERLARLPVEVLSVPELGDIVSGKAKIDELKDVAIEDLLGRDLVPPQQVLLETNIKGKVVMVTGAGGSIGSELCRQILQQKPASLVLFELSEFALYKIDSELNQIKQTEGYRCNVVPLLGSVQRQRLLETIMSSFKVQTVYHAAAYKHVPLVEFNVVEGVRNNIFGTYYAACAAVKAGVESFVLISTDKAVRPTNVMGATKRMTELGLQALAEQEAKKACGTCFSMVRFGNVLGSSGSVIPLFKKQIAMGGPVTVTHPQITRYFMTIPEAAQLVIQAGAMAKGGDVFVLDMGESVKIADLAQKLIHLSGLEVKSDANPYGDIEIKFASLRPGEKLYEELLIGGNVEKSAHERIMTAREVFMPRMDYEALLSQLDLSCHTLDQESIRELLLKAPTGFVPTEGIHDLVWEKNHSKEASLSKTLEPY